KASYHCPQRGHSVGVIALQNADVPVGLLTKQLLGTLGFRIATLATRIARLALPEPAVRRRPAITHRVVGIRLFLVRAHQPTSAGAVGSEASRRSSATISKLVSAPARTACLPLSASYRPMI